MPNMDILPSDGVTLSRASQLTGIGRRQLIRLIERGVIVGAYKLDGQTGAWLIPASELDRLGEAAA